jgi:hypothetical protein
LGTAAHSLHARQRATEIKKSFRSIMEEWHGRGSRRYDG